MAADANAFLHQLPPPPPPPPPIRRQPAPSHQLAPGRTLRFPFTPNGHTIHATVVAIDGPMVALDLLIATLPEHDSPAQQAPPIRTVAPISHILSIWQLLPAPAAAAAGNLSAPAREAAAA